MSALDQLLDFVRRLGAPRVAAALVITGVGVAGIWGLVAWGNRPEFVPIVHGVPLDVVAGAERALGEAGIESQLSRSGGEVLVREEDAARARVALAERGVAAGSRPGFEIFDEATWGMTDFTQRINYRRALEGELERSIAQMRGISSAEVHLALREGSVYQTAGQPVEASVLLSVASGARPTTQQVEAITFLVASAVDGLSSEAVSVLDDAGRVLSAAAEPNTPSRLDRRRLEMQLEVEDYLETRAAELLEPLIGAANVRVRVSAELDFEQVERRVDSVDPNQQVLTGEERSEIEPGDPAQGAASTIEHNTFDVTRSTEVSMRAPGAIRRLTVAVALNEDVPRVGNAALVQRIEQLVRNAVGIDDTRGDAVSVVAVPFEPIQPTLGPDDSTPPPGALDLLREFQRPLVLLVGLLLAFALAMRGLSFARASLPEPAPVLPPGAGQRTSLASTDGGARLPLDRGGEAIVGGPQVDASRVVRAWLGEG